MTRAHNVLIACGLSLAVLILAPPTAAQQEGPIQALVPDDFGDVTATVARMEAHGWVVTAAPSLEIMEHWMDTSPFAGYHVIWVSAQSGFRELHFLLDAGKHLDEFVSGGGVVMVVEISPEIAWLDLAPGGPDAEALLPEEAGAVAITATDHPLITGAGIDGVSLADIDLDSGGGPSALLVNPPPEAQVTVIAENALGPVLMEYPFGAGHVLLSGLPAPSDNCVDNLVRYAQSLVP